jgi:3-oxoadipate enol-lactonase
MISDFETGDAEVNGTRLYYEAAGSGPDVVLVHGFGLDRRMWDDQFGAFAERRRVVRYDLRGFGRSALPVAGAGYRHHADLIALMDHLGLARAALVGLSLGGLVVLNATLEFPERVSALVLSGAIVSGRRMSAAWEAGYRAVRQTAREQGTAVGKQAWLNIDLFAPTRAHPTAGPRLREITEDWSGWQLVNRDPENTQLAASARLGEVSVPSLVFVGERDQPDFLAIADELGAGLPHGRQVVVPGAGHLLPMETPSAFNTTLAGFLQET